MAIFVNKLGNANVTRRVLLSCWVLDGSLCY